MFGLPVTAPAGEAVSGEGEGQRQVTPGEPSRTTPAHDAATALKRSPGDFTLLSNKPNPPATTQKIPVPEQPSGDPLGTAPPQEFPAPPSKQAGVFTNSFAVKPEPTRPASEARPAGAFTKMFSAAAAAAPAAHSANEAKKPGAFTELFSPPVATPAAPPAPAASARPAGAFTKLFSTPAATPAAPPASAKQPGAFTSLFSTPVPARGTPVEAPSDTQPVDDSFAAFAKGAPLTPTPAVPRTRPGDPLAAKVTPGAEAATRIFARPGAGATPAPPVASGPSAFTRIVSAPQPHPPAPPPAAVPGPNPPAVPMPALSPLPVPQMQAPPMPTPYMQVPGMQVPGMQMPQPPMPAAPAPPPPVAAPPNQVNWMPLVIGINVLFMLAIIVILIFALKK